MRSLLLGNVNRVSITPVVFIDFRGAPISFRGDAELEMGVGYLRLGGSANSQTITISNARILGDNKRVSDLFSLSNPIHGRQCSIHLDISGRRIPLFVGVVSALREYSRSAVTFELQDYGAFYRRNLGTVLTKEDYPEIPSENIGKIIPWVWGSISDFKPVLVDENKRTKLTRSLTTTDTTAYVADATEMPDVPASPGYVTVQINDEKLRYTGKDTSTPGEHKLTGLTRGVDGTDAGSHVVGNEVIEVGTLEFLVANHDVSSIDNVRALDQSGATVNLDSSLYAIQLTKPAKITFSESPLYEIAADVHNLKLIDADTLVGTSGTVDNPTFMIGDNINWSETNYAVIHDGSYADIKRAASVSEPTGKPIRAWVVVEAWQSTSGIGEIWWDNGSGFAKLGDIPDKTNTPEDVKQDQTIITMGQGFQAGHSHTISASNHSHIYDLPQLHFLPDEDDYIPTSTNTKPAYDGSDATYADLHLYGGTGYTETVDFSTNQTKYPDKRIAAVRAKITFEKVPNTGGTGKNKVKITSRHKKWASGGGGTYEITLFDGDLDVNSGDYKAGEPYTADSGWVDTTGISLFTLSDGNAVMRVTSDISGNLYTDIRIYNIEWEYALYDTDTEDTDIGDTDVAGAGEQSVLGWYEITSDISDWQDFVNKTLRVKNTSATSSDVVYVLRFYFVAEFAPSEKRVLTDVVCDVNGRSGSFSDIITDVLSESDLLGIPSSRISIATLSTSGVGALTENVDGFDFLDSILQQARARGFWGYDGIFYVKERKAISSLPSAAGFEPVSEPVASSGNISDLANKIILRYNYSHKDGAFKSTKTVTDSDSVSLYGTTKEMVVDAPFVVDDSDADALANFILEYKRRVWNSIDFTAGVSGLEIEPGDIVRIDAKDFNFDKIEVFEVRVLGVRNGAITVSVKGNSYNG